MIFRSKFTSLVFLALFTCQAAQPMARYHVYPAYARSSSGDAATVAKVIAGAGCIAAIGYGLYKLCDWLFSPSNETIIQNSLNALQDAHARYDDTVRFLDASISGIPENSYDQKKLINNFSEQMLYDLAINHIKESSYSYQMNLANVIANIRSCQQALAGRIKKLRNNPEHSHTVSQMQGLEKECLATMNKLQFLHDYVVNHQGYFRLFETETRLLHIYEFELNALYQHGANPAYLREALRTSVMKHAAQERLAYPFMHYVDKLQGDINTLNTHSTRLSYNYANRISVARDLYARLQAINNVVIVEDAYHQELRDYEHARIEKQKLEAQKAQAAAAAAQAAAMQQQTYAMQQANALQAQQNALIAAHVVNPKPQVTVYL